VSINGEFMSEIESDSEIDLLRKGERKFLHDIANDIVVAQGMANFVLKKMKDNKPMEAKDLERLEKSLEAIAKMTQKIKDRRSVLIGSVDVVI
jgi:hypothetical protein